MCTTMPAGRIDTPVSTMDVVPTVCELAGLDITPIAAWTDGESLVGLANGVPRIYTFNTADFEAFKELAVTTP